ncbi:VOC family protein [Nocardioides insulae]|uniref:VOC family protein n=1 Tax=Nocardioides insulae TaxID=394734 RepID=UPI00041F8EBF|nr:VOC family protein [Nocardioides insulae]
MATLNPYLSFDGDARAALEFYAAALGGQLEISTFGEFASDEMPVEPDQADLVMHGQVTTEDGLVLMASDTPAGMTYVAPTPGVTIAHTGGPADHDRLRAAFAALSEGGQVEMPLELAPWGDHYGAFTDRFGVSWMFDIGTE